MPTTFQEYVDAGVSPGDMPWQVRLQQKADNMGVALGDLSRFEGANDNPEQQAALADIAFKWAKQDKMRGGNSSVGDWTAGVLGSIAADTKPYIDAANNYYSQRGTLLKNTIDLGNYAHQVMASSPVANSYIVTRNKVPTRIYTEPYYQLDLNRVGNDALYNNTRALRNSLPGWTAFTPATSGTMPSWVQEKLQNKAQAAGLSGDIGAANQLGYVLAANQLDKVKHDRNVLGSSETLIGWQNLANDLVTEITSGVAAKKANYDAIPGLADTVLNGAVYGHTSNYDTTGISNMFNTGSGWLVPHVYNWNNFVNRWGPMATNIVNSIKSN